MCIRDSFWAKLRVQLHLPPVRSLDLLISPGTLRTIFTHIYLLTRADLHVLTGEERNHFRAWVMGIDLYHVICTWHACIILPDPLTASLSPVSRVVWSIPLRHGPIWPIMIWVSVTIPRVLAGEIAASLSITLCWYTSAGFIAHLQSPIANVQFFIAYTF